MATWQPKVGEAAANEDQLEDRMASDGMGSAGKEPGGQYQWKAIGHADALAANTERNKLTRSRVGVTLLTHLDGGIGIWRGFPGEGWLLF